MMSIKRIVMAMFALGIVPMTFIACAAPPPPAVGAIRRNCNFVGSLENTCLVNTPDTSESGCKAACADTNDTARCQVACVEKNCLWDCFIEDTDLTTGRIYDSLTIWPNNFQYKTSGAIGPGAAPEEIIDLAGRNLTGADFRGSDLTNVTLEGADLEGADLTGAILPAVMTSVVLSGANLSKADLSAVKDLDSANLLNANLAEADIRGTDMTGATVNFRRYCPRLYDKRPGGMPLETSGYPNTGEEPCHDSDSGWRPPWESHLYRTKYDDNTQWAWTEKPKNFTLSQCDALGPDAILTGADLGGVDLSDLSLTGSAEFGRRYYYYRVPADWEKGGLCTEFRVNEEGKRVKVARDIDLVNPPDSEYGWKLRGRPSLEGAGNVDIGLRSPTGARFDSDTIFNNTDLKSAYMSFTQLQGVDLSGALNLDGVESWWQCVYDDNTTWPGGTPPEAVQTHCKKVAVE